MITVEKLGIPPKLAVKHGKFSNLTKYFLVKLKKITPDKRYVDIFL